MSGRIRTIKPELLEDAVTAGLSDMAFRIFIATILLADDFGRLRFEPAWLQGQVFWARKVDADVFATALTELGPLVHDYVVNGQRYAAIRNWAKHQKVSHPGKPRIPAPPESLPPPSGKSPETRVPDLGSWITDLGSPTREGDLPARAAEPSVLVDPAEQIAPDVQGVWDTKAMSVAFTDPIQTVWERFGNHFAGKAFPSRKAMLGRWSIWLTDQAKFDARDRVKQRTRAGPRSERQPLGNTKKWLKTGTENDL